MAFAHSGPKHPPTPPFAISPRHPWLTLQLPKFTRDTILSCPCTYIHQRFSIVTTSVGFPRLIVRVPVFTGKILCHHSHSHVIDPCTASSQSCLVCAVPPGSRGEAGVDPSSPLRGEKQKPTWPPGVCPCPFPGHYSLWCILALGNIDLNALCFDLNQLLPVYLYR